MSIASRHVAPPHFPRPPLPPLPCPRSRSRTLPSTTRSARARTARSSSQKKAPPARSTPQRYARPSARHGGPPLLRQGGRGHLIYNDMLGVVAPSSSPGQVLSKARIVKEGKLKYVTTERNLLDRCAHAGIIKLYFTFQDPAALYLILELAPHGELFDVLRGGKVGSPRRRRRRRRGSVWSIRAVIADTLSLCDVHRQCRSRRPSTVRSRLSTWCSTWTPRASSTATSSRRTCCLPRTAI